MKGFLKRVESRIQRKGLLNHPFYKMWSCGELKIEQLQKYSKQYFFFESNYSRFISSVHSKIEDTKVRQIMLENIMDEERGNKNHQELWLRFCEALGLKRDDVINSKMLPGTKNLIKTYYNLSKNPIEGLAALFAFESQIPDVAEEKIRGLKEFYNLDRGIEFFLVHREMDVWHSKNEWKAIKSLVKTKKDEIVFEKALNKALNALNKFLDNVYKNN